MSCTTISKVIQECYVHLEDGFYSARLVSQLYSANCIRTEEMEEVKCCPTDIGKSRKLLDIIRTKSDDLMDKILEFLHEDGTQPHFEALLHDSAVRFGLDADRFRTGARVAECGRVQLLPNKWWPEHMELITSFIERHGEGGELLVTILRSQLMSSDQKVAAIVSRKHVLVGMGGIGKTSTAKWYANYYEETYDHIFWIDSEGQALAHSLTRLGEALSVLYISPSLPILVQSIYDKLYGIYCLFIFDNAERFEGENGLRSLLPRQQSHHALITSRNHDWGNPNEFGQIPTFQLSVFTETECLSLLRGTLAHKPEKTGSESDMLSLGLELGFLPLALQCAVATIIKSTRYNVKSYLDRIRVDMSILVNKRILSEYDRSITATLNLSIEQIELDGEIDAECRNCCMTILKTAAFCEPNGINEKMFRCPTMSTEVISDAIDQLLVYSLISSEYRPYYETSRTFGIHRLLQHVLRENVFQCTQDTANVLQFALGCFQTDLLIFRQHVERAWQVAAPQMDQIIATKFPTFPYELALCYGTGDHDYLTNTLLKNVERIFKQSDLVVIQVKLKLIDVLLRREDTKKQALDVFSSILEVLNASNKEEVPFLPELLLHMKIIELEIKKILNTSELKDLLESYANVLQELSRSEYDGMVGGTTKLHHAIQSYFQGLPLRIAILLEYVECLSSAGQEQEAIAAMRDEIKEHGQSLDIACLCNIDDFLYYRKYDNILRAIVPNMYKILKTKGIDTKKLTAEQTKSVGKILMQHVKRFGNSASDSVDRFAGIADVFVFLGQVIYSSEACYLVDAILEIVRQCNIVSWPLDRIEPLVSPLNSVWLQWAAITPRAIAVDAEVGGKCLARLLQLNTTYSCVLVLCDRGPDMLTVLKSTSDLLDRSKPTWVTWRVVHKEQNECQYHESALQVSHMAMLFREKEQVLQGKLTQILQVICLSRASSAMCFLASQESLMAAYDDACYLHLLLGQKQRARALWDESFEFFLGPKPVPKLYLYTVIHLGRHTLAFIEEEMADPVLLIAFMKPVAKCIQVVLYYQQDLYCHEDVTRALQIMIRLMEQGYIRLTLELMNKLQQEDQFNSEENRKTFDSLEALRQKISRLETTMDDEQRGQVISELRRMKAERPEVPECDFD